MGKPFCTHNAPLTIAMLYSMARYTHIWAFNPGPFTTAALYGKSLSTHKAYNCYLPQPLCAASHVRPVKLIYVINYCDFKP